MMSYDFIGLYCICTTILHEITTTVYTYCTCQTYHVSSFRCWKFQVEILQSKSIFDIIKWRPSCMAHSEVSTRLGRLLYKVQWWRRRVPRKDLAVSKPVQFIRRTTIGSKVIKWLFSEDTIKQYMPRHQSWTCVSNKHTTLGQHIKTKHAVIL